jgi:hypothetical protein
MEESKKPVKKDDRRQRLAAALRANLARRKDQARARSERREAGDERVPKR